MLLDTCILVDCLRRDERAWSFILGLPAKPKISAITIAELYAGLRANEGPLVVSMLNTYEALEVNADVAIQAGHWLNRYTKSHGLGIGDALIAATAHEHGLTLATLNTKHFSMLDAVHRPY